MSLLSHLFICAITYLCQYEFMCCDLNVCISPNSYVEIVTPQNDGIMKCGGRCLGHENGVFMNGISALKRDSREIPSPFYHLKIQQEGAGYKLERESSQKHDCAVVLILVFQALQVLEISSSCLYTAQPMAFCCRIPNRPRHHVYLVYILCYEPIPCYYFIV